MGRGRYRDRRRKLQDHTFGGSDRHSRGQQAERKAVSRRYEHGRALSDRRPRATEAQIDQAEADQRQSQWNRSYMLALAQIHENVQDYARADALRKAAGRIAAQRKPGDPFLVNRA